MLQIYVPNGIQSPKLLESIGLEDLACEGEAGNITPILERGPDGNGGLLIELGRPTGDWKSSRWEPCCPDPIRKLPAARFMWGWQMNQQFVPEFFARPSQVNGRLRELGDGNRWLLPNMLMLPHRFTIDLQTGEEVREVHPNSKALYDRLVWAFDVCKAAIEGTSAIPDKEAREFLIEAIGVNYRINRELAYRLRLLEEDNWFQHLAHVTDIDRLMRIQNEFQKKSSAVMPPG